MSVEESATTPVTTNAGMANESITFVLIHGAWHGAWCWDRLTASLHARGHKSVAMDLPIEDGTATFQHYAKAVIDAIPDNTDNVVLVGHSLGGMTLPLAAALRPVRAAVFLCGVVPVPGGSPWGDGPHMTEHGVFDDLVTLDDGSTYWPALEPAAAAFYPDCNATDAKWAFDRLRRQNSASLWTAPYPQVAMPPNAISIVGTYDRVVSMPWSLHVAFTRLGMRPIELPTAHSPFLSHPDLLADTLIAQVT